MTESEKSGEIVGKGDSGIELSVLMSVFSDPIPMVKLAIDSVLRQTHSGFQFVIVNNNPGNIDLLQVLREYANSDQRIEIVENEEHTLLSESLNNGLSAVKGRFLARMDADDVALSNRFEDQLAFLKKDESISLVGSDVVLIDEDGNEMSLLKRPASNRLIDIFHRYGIGSCIMHPTWMGKTALFKSLGGYRSSLSNTEDYDLLLRGSIAGYCYANLSKPLLQYRIRQGLSVQNIASQMNYAKLLGKLYRSGKLNEKDTLKNEMHNLQLRLQKKSGRETEALLQLYEFKNNLSSSEFLAAIKSLSKAAYLSPTLAFDVILRNSVLNKLLVFIG